MVLKKKVIKRVKATSKEESVASKDNKNDDEQNVQVPEENYEQNTSIPTPPPLNPQPETNMPPYMQPETNMPPYMHQGAVGPIDIRELRNLLQIVGICVVLISIMIF